MSDSLAAVCTKSQMAAYFGMTEKTFRAVEERQPKVLPPIGQVEQRG